MKGEALRGGGTQGKGPKKRKDPRGNNPRQESSKKLRVKRTERKKERKKESGKKKRENMTGIGGCINRLSFPSFLANQLFGIPKVVTSSHLGIFSKMHNFVGKSL